MDKPIAFVSNVDLLFGEDCNKEAGKIYLHAKMIADGSNRIAQNLYEGEFFTTTEIINVDWVNRTFETKNTIYQAVAACQRDAILLLVPQSEMLVGKSAIF